MLIQNTRQMSNPLTLLHFDTRGLYQLFLRHLKKITTMSPEYIPSGYTEEQMRRDIIKGLELLKRQRERNRDAR